MTSVQSANLELNQSQADIFFFFFTSGYKIKRKIYFVSIGNTDTFYFRHILSHESFTIVVTSHKQTLSFFHYYTHIRT